MTVLSVSAPEFYPLALRQQMDQSTLEIDKRGGRSGGLEWVKKAETTSTPSLAIARTKKNVHRRRKSNNTISKRPRVIQRYNIDFLLQFSNRTAIPPVGVTPNFDVVAAPPECVKVTTSLTPMTSAKTKSRPQQQQQPVTTANTKRVQEKGGKIESQSRKKSGKKKGGAQPPSKITTEPLLELALSPDRWKPTTCARDDETGVAVKAVRGVLNKLAPERFDVLADEVTSVTVTCEATLTAIVTAIYEKALQEPPFCGMYADLYAHVCADLPEVPTSDCNQRSLCAHQVLLRLVQDEINAAPIDSEDEEASNAQRCRRMGHAVLAGELLQRGLLSKELVKTCIDVITAKLPQQIELESLCALLPLVACVLDESDVEGACEALTTLSKDTTLCSRLRFMIQDCLDLRKKAWTPRHSKVQPKLLSEIRAEAEAASPRRTSPSKPVRPHSLQRPSPSTVATSSPARSALASARSPRTPNSRTNSSKHANTTDNNNTTHSTNSTTHNTNAKPSTTKSSNTANTTRNSNTNTTNTTNTTMSSSSSGGGSTLHGRTNPSAVRNLFPDAQENQPPSTETRTKLPQTKNHSRRQPRRVAQGTQ